MGNSLASELAALGGNQGTPATDQFSAVDKQGATNAILSLLKTGNPGLINTTIGAINKSAGYGNTYDKFKQSLLQSYTKNSPYASLLSQAKSYKAPPSQTAAKPAAPQKSFISQVGSGLAYYPEAALNRLF